MSDHFRRNVFLSDIEYKVIQVLDNEMLLVVKFDDYNQNIAPLQTFVIPDPMYT